MRKVFALFAALFALSSAMQLYFATIGVFSPDDSGLFNIHGTNGRIVLPILAALTIIGAIVAKAGRREIVWSVIGLVLIMMQTVLVNLAGTFFGVVESRHDNIPIGASILLGFHGLVGLGIIVVSGYLARKSWVSAFPKAVKTVPTPAAEAQIASAKTVATPAVTPTGTSTVAKKSPAAKSPAKKA